MKKKELEKRSYFFEIRAEESEQGAIITGRPVVYNSKADMGYFEEFIDPGALNNTDLTDVRFLVNHDISKIPLARSRKNTPNSTMQLTPDALGLAIRVLLDVENNSEARNLFSAVKRGDITGMSFMFSVESDEWSNLESDYPTRHIKALASIVEVSAVTFPAYEATEINARSKEALENAKKALENAKRALDTDQVETRSKDKNLELLKLKTQSIFLGR